MKALAALLTLALSAVAAPVGPGETALRFLEKIRANQLDLAPGTDTALAPQTSERKREEIARRLDRLSADLGTGELVPGPVKLDGEFAAVLIRKPGGFDPSELQVFPVALVFRGAKWLAAPMPASFENSGAGYASDLRKRLDSLEQWMLRQQVIDSLALRETSAKMMRREIEASLPKASIKAFTAADCLDAFLRACEQQELPKILGLLGGLSDPLPDDWPQRLRAANAAFSPGRESPQPWRLLTSPGIYRTLVLLDEAPGGAIASVACLDPDGGPSGLPRPKIEIVHLQLEYTSRDHWRIDPPAAFIDGGAGPDFETDEELDADLLDQFAENLKAKHPPEASTTATAARDALADTLSGSSLPALFRRIRFTDDPETIRNLAIAAARLWRDVHSPASLCLPIPLEIHEFDQNAAASFQFFSARNPDRFDIRVFYFQSGPDGWLWRPLTTSADRKGLDEWGTRQNLKWSETWRNALLADSAVLTEIPADSPPAPDAARLLLEQWFRAIRARDIHAALQLTARLDTPQSSETLLRNLGYEISASHAEDQTPDITETLQGRTWTAVGARTGPIGKTIHPLYPVVQTSEGPRILLEVDLFATEKRSRKFLNRTSLAHLRNFDPAASKELEELLGQFQPIPAPTPEP